MPTKSSLYKIVDLGFTENLVLFEMIHHFMAILVFIVILGACAFILNYGHLLNSLLALELLSVALYLFISIVFRVIGRELFYLLFFLVLVVCEGVLGLSLLIFLTHRHGEDYFKSINTVQC
jgi:NADH:ubiquinone oxidoreductase subunit K